MIKKYALLLSLLTAAFLVPTLAPASRAETSREMTGVVSKVLVKASPEEVFDAIRRYRHSDAKMRTVVKEEKEKAIIDEKFKGLPILGDVECQYEEIEVPYTRVEFHLVKSEKLKVFEGSWIVTGMNDNKESLVRITSYLDTFIQCPGKDFLTHMSVHSDLHRRLDFVKKVAEAEEAKTEASTN